MPITHPAEWAARLSIVRGFARHWSATDPSTEVPPLGLLPYRPARAQPYFYSDHEIRTLLKAAKTRPSIDPLRPWTYHCLFGLLAVTGLRLGEALNLRTGGYGLVRRHSHDSRGQVRKVPSGSAAYFDL